MSTRASIAYTTADGIRGVYCHFDGGEYTAEILKSHYTAAYKIGKLIELGDLSSIDGEIADCTFYGRDRGESFKNVCAADFNTVDEWTEHFSGCDYFYLYDSSKGEWSVGTTGVHFTNLII